MWSYGGKGFDHGAAAGGEGVLGVLGKLEVEKILVVAPVF